MGQVIKSPNAFQRLGYWLRTIAHRNCQRRIPQGIGLLPTLCMVEANALLFARQCEDPIHNISQ